MSLDARHSKLIKNVNFGTNCLGQIVLFEYQLVASTNRCYEYKCYDRIQTDKTKWWYKLLCIINVTHLQAMYIFKQIDLCALGKMSINIQYKTIYCILCCPQPLIPSLPRLYIAVPGVQLAKTLLSETFGHILSKRNVVIVVDILLETYS